MRPLALLLTLVLGVALTGCSPSKEDVREDYCEAVTDRQRTLTDVLAEDSPDALLKALPTFHELADQAPSDIQDEWKTFLDALDGLEEALDEAGVDAATYDAKKPPADVTPEQQDAIAAAADQLVDPEVATAYEGVKQHAKDVCQTPLFQ